jgi:hypothetical protein
MLYSDSGGNGHGANQDHICQVAGFRFPAADLSMQ